jgi:hypothetical protein
MEMFYSHDPLIGEVEKGIRYTKNGTGYVEDILPTKCLTRDGLISGSLLKMLKNSLLTITPSKEKTKQSHLAQRIGIGLKSIVVRKSKGMIENFTCENGKRKNVPLTQSLVLIPLLKNSMELTKTITTECSKAKVAFVQFVKAMKFQLIQGLVKSVGSPLTTATRMERLEDYFARVVTEGLGLSEIRSKAYMPLSIISGVK